MRRWPLLTLAALTLLLALGGPAPGRAGTLSTAAIDTTCKYPDSLYYTEALKVIWRPIVNVPTILRAGDTLSVWANASSSVTGWGASLRFGALLVPLTPAGGGYSTGMGLWVLSFQVPPGTAEEVYDLILASSSTVTDTTHHSVKVIPAFHTDYYFAQISDTHLPSETTSSSSHWSSCDTSSMGDLDAVIDDLNYIHPEFVLHTGDFVNEGGLGKLYHMYEYARGKQMLYRFHDPVFVVSGNHDTGGWKATSVLAGVAGSARKDWWRFLGWPFLWDSAAVAPHPAYPYHSQMYSFNYDSLHVVGMEAYLNNGSYDNYETNIYGGGSLTNEEMTWLTQDLAAAGTRHKLLFYHFDFDQGQNTGSLSGPFQVNVSALGLDGAIFGHLHSTSEGSRTIPFNLEEAAVTSGGRHFRMFRVHNGVMSPTLMQRAGSSLSKAWSGPNDGTRTRLTVALTNSYTETWEHARVVFHMVDHDSNYAATGGTLAQTIREGGKIHVYVDCVLTGGGAVTTVSVYPTTPIVVGVGGAPVAGLRLERPAPTPFRAGGSSLALRYSLPAAVAVRLEVLDLAGRRVAVLADGRQGPGGHSAAWDGRADGGAPVAAGLYFVRLTAGGAHETRRVVLVK
ncbi:MAG TPA: metallophosphoesterase [Candidatus Saccharimonadales bacterium]|nr:metallophosphoesterase [Candidatus Saccharimonadales bacterium]